MSKCIRKAAEDSNAGTGSRMSIWPGGAPKSVLARDHGISREAAHQHLRLAALA